MSDLIPQESILTAAISRRSAWSTRSIVAFLDDCLFPVRISSLNADGYPQITSLWYVLRQGKLLCCSRPGSLVCLQIAQNPRVAFEVAANEPPYFGVSGQADARIVDGDAGELLATLIDRYLQGQDPDLRAWLLSRASTESIIEVEPRRITSWDFRPRMSAPQNIRSA